MSPTPPHVDTPLASDACTAVWEVAEFSVATVGTPFDTPPVSSSVTKYTLLSVQGSTHHALQQQPT